MPPFFVAGVLAGSDSTSCQASSTGHKDLDVEQVQPNVLMTPSPAWSVLDSVMETLERASSNSMSSVFNFSNSILQHEVERGLQVGGLAFWGEIRELHLRCLCGGSLPSL